jgi:YD repeat-containing protein
MATSPAPDAAAPPGMCPGVAVLGGGGAGGDGDGNGDGLRRTFGVRDGKRHRLTAVEERNGNRIALAYEDGRLAEVTDSAGRVLRVRGDLEGRRPRAPVALSGTRCAARTTARPSK